MASATNRDYHPLAEPAGNATAATLNWVFGKSSRVGNAPEVRNAMSTPVGSSSDSGVTVSQARGQGPLVRRRFDVRGRVQGVGFRPFVARLAAELQLGGLVGNDPRGAFIEVEGPAEVVDVFADRLSRELPPLASISQLAPQPIAPRNQPTFRIVLSKHEGEQKAEIAPDVATCPDCLAELFDPNDRRYRYPFTNCTNCGPRYSIIQAVPYDRPNTTMSRFIMCPACQAEYDNPLDRRFHAQPNACPVCGPHLWLTDFQGQPVSGDPVRVCAEWLRCGAIVAIKGIGGFHLACCADNDMAVTRLRKRKAREAKPLAMMVPSLEVARDIAEIDESAALEIEGMLRPIVLVPQRPDTYISRHVAPDNAYFGLMLPYTPLHHLLFAEGLWPLVMTSANPTEEPLCCDNEEAGRRLSGLADAFLMHNRDIERRVDDSVMLAVEPGGAAKESLSRVVPIRRARGYAPEPIPLPDEAPEPILAVGGELKSAICLLNGRDAVLSEHLGELSNPVTYRHFLETIDRFKALLQVEPRVVAYDLHPDYAATRYACALDLEAIGVQHHHAHIVSCMADNSIRGEVIGLACDGTGYGTDGSIWGCEILVGDEASFTRAGHLASFPLLGGDMAAMETWRPAAGLLHEAFGGLWRSQADFALQRVEADALTLAEQRLAGEARVINTSSLGRLFDAVAFLLGLCDYNQYEAEAAILLEAVARQTRQAKPLAYSIEETGPTGETFVLDAAPMIREIVAGMLADRSEGILARAFHETLAMMLTEGANRAAEQYGINRVVLSGGCFVNQLLLERVSTRLLASGREVFAHRRIPPGDGGLALGQAASVAASLRRKQACA